MPAAALAAAMLAPAAVADTVTVREAKPPTVTPRVITPAPTPQPESAPPAAGGESVVGAARHPEAAPLPERVPSAPDPVPMPNVTPVPSLRGEGQVGAELSDLLATVSDLGEQILSNGDATFLIPAILRAQSDSPSEPNPLVEIPAEANLLPMAGALKTIAGVWLVEAAIAEATKSVASARCGEPRVDDNGVAYCPK